MVTTLGFTGDVMLGRGVDHRQRTSTRTPVDVWGDVIDDLRGLDGLVINLECALSDRGEMWTRTHRPFHFRASPDWAIPALTDAGVDCCALANNHLLDFEVPALEDTLDVLDDAGITRSGAGRDEDDALEPAVFDAGEHRVAVVSLTDNTPEYAADEYAPGTAYVQPDPADNRTRRVVHESLDRARTANPDVLIASVHLGPNMVEYPNETHQRFTRWLVDQDVDIVHGHSAHVFQGVERYEEGVIIHDAGDFVDDYVVDDRLRNDRSFLYELRLDDQTATELLLHPVTIMDRHVQQPITDTDWWPETFAHRTEPFDTAFGVGDDGTIRVPLGFVCTGG